VKAQEPSWFVKEWDCENKPKRPKPKTSKFITMQHWCIINGLLGFIMWQLTNEAHKHKIEKSWNLPICYKICSVDVSSTKLMMVRSNQ